MTNGETASPRMRLRGLKHNVLAWAATFFVASRPMTTKLSDFRSLWGRKLGEVVRKAILGRSRQSVIFPFVLVGMVSSMAGADPKPTAADCFALYPIVADDALNRTFAKNFHYESAFDKSEIVSGLYRPEPVLTFDHIEKVAMSCREIQAAPIDGVHFTLNDAGVRKLSEYLRQPNAREMVVFIDGYAYATVSLDLALKMADQRVLWVIPPQPQQDITHRFLVLLLDKLRTRLATQRDGKN